MGRARRLSLAVAAPPTRRGATSRVEDYNDPRHIFTTLETLCEGLETFPDADAFHEAGLSTLYDILVRDDTCEQWASLMGLPMPPKRDHTSSGGRPHKRTPWSQERIEAALDPFCAGRETYPSVGEFAAAGLSGLYTEIGRSGGHGKQAQRLGLLRARQAKALAPKWTEEAISTALTALCEGKTMFPSVGEFKAAGLDGLYQALRKRGDLDTWVQRMGLERRQVNVLDTSREFKAARAAGDLKTRLQALVGVDLRHLQRLQAGSGDETLRPKSWAQYALRHILGKAAEDLPLRVIPARANADGGLTFTSTMPLAPIDIEALLEQSFEESAVAKALEDIIVVARAEEARARPSSRVLDAKRFRLEEHPQLAARIRADYDLVVEHLRAGGELQGGLGELIQPRTKGAGGEAERTFAFYARPNLISAMLVVGEDASLRANEQAREARAFKARRPTPERLHKHLQTLLEQRGQTTFPSPDEFKDSGNEELYWQLRATKDLREWAEDFGMKHAARTEWTGPRIEEDLANLLNGRAVFPSQAEFSAAGEDGRRLYKHILMYGGRDFWARWMGVMPRQPQTADIEQALKQFTADRDTWPTENEFKLAGLGRLHSALKVDGGSKHWQEKLGLDTRLWTPERTTSALRTIAERLGRFPTHEEMRRFGRGLEDVVSESGGSSKWAATLGLEAPQRGRRANAPTRSQQQTQPQQVPASDPAADSWWDNVLSDWQQQETAPDPTSAS